MHRAEGQDGPKSGSHPPSEKNDALSSSSEWRPRDGDSQANSSVQSITSAHMSGMEDSDLAATRTSAEYAAKQPGSSRVRTQAGSSKEQYSPKPWVYRPRKHGLCYVSTLKSQPSHGFGRAKRPCNEVVKKEVVKEDVVDEGDAQPHTHKASHASRPNTTGPRRVASPGGRPTSVAGSFSQSERSYFLFSPEYFPAMRSLKFGTQSPGPYIGPEGIRDMTSEAAHVKPAFFKGSTTFGTAKMTYQRLQESVGPGPSSVPNLPRKGNLGGRFNRQKSLSLLDRQLRAAKDLPGPATYQAIKPIKVPGGRFNMSEPQTELALITRHAKLLPGPADYNVQKPWGFSLGSRIPGGHPLPAGGRVMFDQYGEGIGMRGAKGQWIIKSLTEDILSRTPGPGHYYRDVI